MAVTNIAIIPARGGSKRVPGKNIKTLVGKPLIAYTIAAAFDSDLFGRIVVSTDSQEVAEVSLRYGAEVPFLRDKSLADDLTPVSAVTADMLLKLDPTGDKFDCVAQLMPTCPLRIAEDICDAYRQFEISLAEFQISVVRYGWQNPWWAMRRNERQELEPMFKEQLTARSQDLPELFCPTGAIWLARTASLRRTKTFHSENRAGWEIPWQRGIDIDSFEDLAMAEVLLSLPPFQAENTRTTTQMVYTAPQP